MKTAKQSPLHAKSINKASIFLPPGYAKMSSNFQFNSDWFFGNGEMPNFSIKRPKNMKHSTIRAKLGLLKKISMSNRLRDLSYSANYERTLGRNYPKQFKFMSVFRKSQKFSEQILQVT